MKTAMGDNEAGELPMTDEIPSTALPLGTLEPLEPLGFTAGEMAVCGKCGRKNPPNRPRCIYCSAELELRLKTVDGARLVLRELEPWENGFNIVLLPAATPEKEAVAAEIARLINTGKTSTEEIKAAMDSGVPIPIARVETRQVAEAVAGSISAIGSVCRVIADSELAGERQPVRLRKIEFESDEAIRLIIFNGGEEVIVKKGSLRLIVTGSVFETQTTLTEMRKAKRKSVADESQIASDEKVLDLYPAGCPDGFRVLLRGFDFSCLGSESGLLAFENLQKLAARLARCFSEAEVVDDYDRIRHLLDRIWEPESKRDSLGFQRSGFGKFGVSSLARRSNLGQFTKYSRLRARMI